MPKHGEKPEFNKARCLAFVRRLWDLDELAMFHHPVSATELPDYHTVVKRPIDLSTIQRGIENGTYTAEAEVQNDVALMIANALEYNAKGTKWHKQALTFRKTYADLARQSGMAVDVDDIYIPTAGFKDDESSLRRAEKHNREDLGAILQELETEKEVPLEELRAKYQRLEKGEVQSGTKSVSNDNEEKKSEESDEESEFSDSDYSDEDEDGSDYSDEDEEEDYDDDDDDDDNEQ
ncbi:hypothetical protein TRVL_01900 [Trypanosoma vivax]|nr:hypothetical protein TRVL_01900 [Trypanosoma vivax]